MNASLKLALLFIFAQSVQTNFAHVYLEGYVGGMFGRSKISCLKTQNTYDIQGLTAFFDVPTTKKLSPAVTGGFKIGWWPNHCYDVCCKKDHTPWREHFGFYVDTRFNNLDYVHRICSTKVCYSNTLAQASDRTDICLSSKGPSATLAFLFAYRCGFLATDDIPFGQLQPYLAIGPAGLFTRQKMRLVVSPHEADGSHLTVILNDSYTIAPVKKHWASAPCLALDAGMRCLVTPCIPLDFFFNYRFSPIRICNKCAPQLSMKHHYHLFSFGMGVGYEF